MANGTLNRTSGRNWCFTINNPAMGPTALLQTLDNKNIKYAIFQTEQGKAGTKHYQGYLELAHSSRFNYVKRLLGQGAHIERRAGTAVQARDYCRKTEGQLEGPFEHGVFKEPKPGKRTDLQSAIADLATHRDLGSLATEHGSTYIRYHRGFASYLRVTADSRKQPPRVSLYYGSTGTGKTRRAIEDNNDYFRKHPDSKWFDGYNTQECLILDDFSGASSKMSLSYVLQLLDRYPFNLEVKGDYTELLATRIIITTNNHPSTWYDYSSRHEQYKALCRRFHEVIVFTEDEIFEVETNAFFDAETWKTIEPDYNAMRKKKKVQGTKRDRPVLKRTHRMIDLTVFTDDVDQSTIEISEENSAEFDAISEDEDFMRPLKKRKRK